MGVILTSLPIPNGAQLGSVPHVIGAIFHPCGERTRTNVDVPPSGI